MVSLVDAEHPAVRMIRDGAGRNNWTFGPSTKAPQPLKLPPIRHFTIDAGRLTFDDAQRKLHFAGTVSSNERLTGYGAGHFTHDRPGHVERRGVPGAASSAGR